MTPTPPDCGAPCAMCESYAHLLAKAREELEAVRAVLLAAHVTNRGTLAEMAADLVKTATSYRNAVMAAREEVARLKQRIIDDKQPMKLSEWLRGPVPKNDRIINAITAAALIALVAVTIWRNLS